MSVIRRCLAVLPEAARLMSSATAKKTAPFLTEFHYLLPIQAHSMQTRWGDNDQYGHVNNVVYYAWFDTVINHFLIRRGGLDTKGTTIGLCVSSNCTFFKPVSFPSVVTAGLRVHRLGSSSVTYEVGIFEEQAQQAVAVGNFVHVFVNNDTRQPEPIPATLRKHLHTLHHSSL